MRLTLKKYSNCSLKLLRMPWWWWTTTAASPTRTGKLKQALVIGICQERFRANSVQLIVPDIDAKAVILCREVQIEQLLLNLLQNAVDAALEGEGERWVRLKVVTRDPWVVLSVIDSGPGIPPEARSRVMEPFFTTKAVGQGVGLGLSVSKKIAENHGGRLELGERQGRTCFSLVLPLWEEVETLCS